MSSQQTWFDCLVCGQKTRFFHLNAKICRACSSFYRRAITENLHYTCKVNGKCDLGKSKCRACRFQQCTDAGACLAKVTQVDQTVIEQPTSTNGHLNRPKLDALLQGYDLFLMAQRSLFTRRHPELGISNDKMIRAQKKAMISIEIEGIPLVLKFFNDHFGPFKKLTKSQKVEIVIESFADFSVFNKSYLTYKYFPQLEDGRVAHSNGYYTKGPSTDPEWFFDGYVETSRIPDYIAAIEPIHDKMAKNINRARLVKPRKVDIVSLMFLALCKHLEYKNLLTDEMAQYKEELMEEWLESIKDEIEPKDVMTRFTSLMLFYYESDDLVIELDKLKTVLRVYLLRNDEEDLCNIEAYMRKLDLGADDEPQMTTNLP